MISASGHASAAAGLTVPTMAGSNLNANISSHGPVERFAPLAPECFYHRGASAFSEVTDAEVIDAEVIDAEVVDDTYAAIPRVGRSRRTYCVITRHARLLGVAGALGFTLTASACSPGTENVGLENRSESRPYVSPVTVADSSLVYSMMQDDVSAEVYAEGSWPETMASTSGQQPISVTLEPTSLSSINPADFEPVAADPNAEDIYALSAASLGTGLHAELERSFPLTGDYSGFANASFSELEAIRTTLRDPVPFPDSSVAELAGMIGKYFPVGQRGHALAVAWCESSWGQDLRAFDPTWPDAGWLQINRFWHETRAARMGFDWERVRVDLEANVVIALSIWEDSGWDAWTCSKVLPR